MVTCSSSGSYGSCSFSFQLKRAVSMGLFDASTLGSFGSDGVKEVVELFTKFELLSGCFCDVGDEVGVVG